MERIQRTKEHVQPSVGIRELLSDDWRDYEYLRHDMLRSDPEAFPPQAFADLNDREENWRARIEAGIVLAAYDGTKPVGMIRATFDGDNAKIWNMYTKREYRGLGMGKRLMEQLMGKILVRGVREVALEVEDTQIPARTMYQQVFGFQEVGRVPNERGGYMITLKRTLPTVSKS
jgi:ribosomal protein S18 acetylase RimI-like enzyme